MVSWKQRSFNRFSRFNSPSTLKTKYVHCAYGVHYHLREKKIYREKERIVCLEVIKISLLSTFYFELEAKNIFFHKKLADTYNCIFCCCVWGSCMKFNIFAQRIFGCLQRMPEREKKKKSTRIYISAYERQVQHICSMYMGQTRTVNEAHNVIMCNVIYYSMQS